jgi:D-amino-acid dehydrogenase
MKITIIGGGIIGLCSAYYLAQDGHQVQVVDKGDFTDNCSHGNAGLIVPSHVIPLATRGIIKQGLKWMFKRSSPFYFKPRLNLDLALWSWRFILASHPDKVKQAMPVLRDFSDLSKDLYMEMISKENFQVGLKNNGLLMLYKTALAEAEETEVVEQVKKVGLKAQILKPTELAELDPNTKYDVRGAVYYPNDAHLNPARLLTELRNWLERNGVKLIPNFSVSDFNISDNRITSISSGKESLGVEHLVTAGGARTGQLLKKLGIRLLMQDGKGYSFTIKKPANCPTLPAILLEDRVAVTPLENELRIGGAMEISGMDDKIKMNKVEKINEAFKRYYPKTDSGEVQKEDVWWGYRPCSFDGLPYIGKVDAVNNLTVAAGHAMLGLSLGAGTGKFVSEIISGQASSLNIFPFNPQR